MYRNYIWFHGICQLKLRKNYGKMAKNQVFKLKMQLPSKQWVVGSIPARGAIFLYFFRSRSRRPDFFYFHCSGLIFKDLPIFWKNGEFSVFTFRDTQTADLPPNSPFALCRGHTDFKSHNRMKRNNLRKHTPLSVRILQRMVVKYSLFRTENITDCC